MNKPPRNDFGDPTLREFGSKHYMRLWEAQTLSGDEDHVPVYVNLAKMLKVDEKGINLKKRAGGLKWKWMQEVVDLDARDAPKHQPALHDPFSGNELAAHLLDGIGAFLAVAYGGLESAEPDVTKLGVTRDVHGAEVGADGPLRRSVTAIRRAWVAYHRAVTMVGPRPQSVDQFVAGLPDKAVPSKADIDVVEARFQTEYPKWLRSMVAVLTEKGTGLDATVPSKTAAELVAQRVPARREKPTAATDRNVQDKLRELGIDPSNMPEPPRGNKPWALREQVMRDLNLTEDQLRKSITRIRKGVAPSLT